MLGALVVGNKAGHLGLKQPNYLYCNTAASGMHVFAQPYTLISHNYQA